MVMSMGDRMVKKKVLFLRVCFCVANNRHWNSDFVLSHCRFPLTTTYTNQLVERIFSREVDSKTDSVGEFIQRIS